MDISLRKFLFEMLNRRILRIKAFKVLYGSELAGNMVYSAAEAQLDASCEAVRDLYIFMMGIISPLTKVAAERIESAKKKFNPTEEEKNPNMKFARNALARMMDEDPDFAKAFSKRKFSWDQYDIFLKKIYTTILGREYYRKYMEKPDTSLAEDCKLFVKIFEKEFIFSEELSQILEDMSLYWNDDLDYALTCCCRTCEYIAKGGQWRLPPLYQSDMSPQTKRENDGKFVHDLLRTAISEWDRYSAMISEAVSNWEQDRIVSTDMSLIVLGLAEAETFLGIPVKVTINEYVDISKFYGTPKSSVFVNGLLDRLIQKMTNDGLIYKK